MILVIILFSVLWEDFFKPLLFVLAFTSFPSVGFKNV